MKLTYSEKKILDNIHKDITANFLTTKTIRELCNEYTISETKLSKGFKKLFDCSIHAYYLELRMHYAKDQIKDGVDIKVIALALGYSTTSSFIRAFKKIFPKSPGNYKFIPK